MNILIFIVVIFFFCLLLYWNSDAYIIRNGQKTEGVITNVQSRSRTGRYGRVYVSYVVSYQFNDSEDWVWRSKFTIHSSTCGFKEEDMVIVYYLPDKPHKNAVLKSYKLR